MDRQKIEANSAERLVSGQAWEDYCDVLKVAGKVIEDFGDQPSDLDRAEWYRFISRLTRSSLERLLENAEPTRPRLRDMVWRQSISFQTVDQDHLMCQFDEARDYRITGTRGTIPYFVFALLTAPAPSGPGGRNWAPLGREGLREFNPAIHKTTASLGSQEIRFAEDGSFEVILSQRDPGPGKNWLKLDPDTNSILVRLVWSDRSGEIAPVLDIERMDGAKPEPVSPALMANNLAWAGQAVLSYAELVRNWWQGDQGNFSAKLNRLDYSRAQYLSNGGVPDRHVAFGGWEKKLDEVLVLEFFPPECQYWNFQICSIWQENLDTFEDGNGWVNNNRCAFESDGRVRIIISERDPGISGNWLDSYGHDKGQWALRFVQTQGTAPVKLWRLPLARLQQNGAAALDPAEAVDTGQFID